MSFKNLNVYMMMKLSTFHAQVYVCLSPSTWSSCQLHRLVVPNIFGTRDQWLYENLKWWSEVELRRWALQIQMKLCLLTHLLCSLVPNSPTAQELGTLGIDGMGIGGPSTLKNNLFSNLIWVIRKKMYKKTIIKDQFYPISNLGLRKGKEALFLFTKWAHAIRIQNLN